MIRYPLQSKNYKEISPVLGEEYQICEICEPIQRIMNKGRLPLNLLHNGWDFIKYLHYFHYIDLSKVKTYLDKLFSEEIGEIFYCKYCGSLVYSKFYCKRKETNVEFGITLNKEEKIPELITIYFNEKMNMFFNVPNGTKIGEFKQYNNPSILYDIVTSSTTKMNIRRKNITVGEIDYSAASRELKIIFNEFELNENYNGYTLCIDKKYFNLNISLLENYDSFKVKTKYSSNEKENNGCIIVTDYI